MSQVQASPYTRVETTHVAVSVECSKNYWSRTLAVTHSRLPRISYGVICKRRCRTFQALRRTTLWYQLCPVHPHLYPHLPPGLLGPLLVYPLGLYPVFTWNRTE